MVGRLLLFLAFATSCGVATASPIDGCVLYSPSLIGHCALLRGGYKDPSLSTDQKALAYTRDGERLNAGATQAAVADFTSAIPVKKDDPLASYTRGVERLNAGATQLAAADFTDAIRVKKDDAAAFAGRGWAKFSDRDFFGSIADYDEAIMLTPSNPQLYLERCHINIVIGRLENAIRDCTEAIRLDSNYDQAFNARGLAYARGGNFARALQDYNSAIKLNPLVPIYYANRGYTYKAQKRTKDAIEDFLRALQFDPSLSEVMNALARIQPGKAVPTQIDRLIQKGRQVVGKYCRNCHSIDRTDVSHDKNAPAFRSLSARHEAQTLRGPIKRALAAGHDSMPSPKLSFAETEATIAYINSFVRR